MNKILKEYKLIISPIFFFSFLFFLLPLATAEISYDKSKTTATITDSKGVTIGTAKLNTPLVYQVPRGYNKVAEFEVVSQDYSSIDNAINKIELLNMNTGERIDRKLDYKYKIIELYDEPIYSFTCDENKVCKATQVGTEKKSREKWTDISDGKVLLGKGDKLTIGIFTEVQRKDKVEWIPTIMNEKITQWAIYQENTSVGLLLHLPFQTPDTLRDFSPYGNNGTLPLYSTNCTLDPTHCGWNTSKVGNGLQFDGSTSYVTIVNGSLLGDTNVTVMAWVYQNTGGSAFITDNNRGTANGYALKITSTRIEYTLGNGTCYSGQSCCTDYVLTTPTIPTNSWNHYTFELVSNASGNISIYVYKNGVAFANETTCMKGTLTAGTGTQRIGSRNTGAYTYTNGSLDEVKIINRTLSETEITNIYGNESAGTMTNLNDSAYDGTHWNDSGMKGYWEMEGNSLDSSGNGNDGTSSGVTNIKGKVANAYKFDGNDYIYVDKEINADNITISAWVNFSSSSNYEVVFGSCVDPTSATCSGADYDSVECYKDTTNHFYCITSYKSGIEYGADFSTTSVVPTNGQWTYVTFVYNSANYSASKIYFNGTSQALTITCPFGGHCPSSFTHVIRASIGAEIPYYSGSFRTAVLYLNASVDELILLNRTLTDAEVSSLYQSQLPKVLGIWNLNETNGVTASDSSVNGRTGTLWGYSRPYFNSTGGYDSFGDYVFDGTDDYVQVADANSLDVGRYNPYTITAWIYPTKATTISQGVIVKHGDYIASIDTTTATTGKIRFYNDYTSGTVTANLTLNAWNFVTWAYNGTGVEQNGTTLNNHLAYLNGAYIGSVCVPKNATDTNCSSGVSGTGVLTTGFDTSNGAWAFGGKIDDVRVYNRTLTSSEIAEVYSLATYKFDNCNDMIGFANHPFSGNILSSNPYGVQTFWLTDTSHFNIGNTTGIVTNAIWLYLPESYDLIVGGNSTYGETAYCNFTIDITDLIDCRYKQFGYYNLNYPVMNEICKQNMGGFGIK